MFAVIADVWPEVIPVLEVLAVIADAWPEVIPVLAVFVVIADAWAELIPVLAVLAVTAELAVTSVSKSAESNNWDTLIFFSVPASDIINLSVASTVIAVPSTWVSISNVLPAVLIVIVLVAPLPVAVTPEPTKFNVVAAVDNAEPSSFIVISLPPPPIEPSSICERSVLPIYW